VLLGRGLQYVARAARPAPRSATRSDGQLPDSRLGSSPHYTGMAAANFPIGSICGAANGVRPLWRATAVIPFAFAILIVTLLLSRLDSRLDARATFLSNSIAQLNDQIDRMQGPAH
jgi:hypothetical protein